MDVRVLRKVDSSEGAGLKGEGNDEDGELLEMVGLAGGLPEVFLGFGILVAFQRRASPRRVTHQEE